MDKRVVFVEGDDVIRQSYVKSLTNAGFEIDAFSDRHTALAYVTQTMPDLALLEVTLKHERDAGFQLCSDLRRLSPELPIIFLTSRDSELDKISGIRLGADDYLTKDISVDYLAVRMEALLRRFKTLTSSEERRVTKEGTLVCGALTIDREKLTVYWQQQEVDLNLTQFWIIHELVSNLGRIKSYAKLMEAADIHVEPNTIAAHIKAIRDGFKAIDPDFDCIKTVRGSGYRWVEA